MSDNSDLKGATRNLNSLLEYQVGAVVSRTIIKSNPGP